MFVPTESVMVLAKRARVEMRPDSPYRGLMTLRVDGSDMVLCDRDISQPLPCDVEDSKKMEWVARACKIKDRDSRFIIEVSRGVCYNGPLAAWYAGSRGLRLRPKGVFLVSGPSGVTTSLDKYLLLARVARLDRNSHYGVYTRPGLVA